MSDLTPYPFDALVRRMYRELETSESIFDLPGRRFFSGDAEFDYSVDFHGQKASSPLGPAAGPQTQMAQNIVLSWLGGCRVMELKTVQIIDDLEIPRPCIDVHTVGLNAEWSQELTLEQSLDEYVKGAMLIEMLRNGPVQPNPGFEHVIYDMSVGYDLKGIQSPRVQTFVRGMIDCREAVERFRSQIPEEHSELRDLDYPTRLSDTLTLSTFHGCPPEEIESIIEYLLREVGLHSIVKFNPMLLGPSETERLLHDVLGYDDVEVPASAFERDTKWDQAVEMMERLDKVASEVGLGLGAKFSNTLIVRNTRGFLAPEEKEVYLSGQPLHVLAMNLVGQFRSVFGNRFPVSFAAGIDQHNYADAAAIGLAPITVCTDLLRKGGYGRLLSYHAALKKRMQAVGANTLDDFVLKAYDYGEDALASAGLAREDPRFNKCLEALAVGQGARDAAGEELYGRWLSEAVLLNTQHCVEATTGDPRYSRAQNSRAPRKIGSHLELFDCVTCDICVPVCPNDANFTFGSEQREIPVVKATRVADGWSLHQEEVLSLKRKHQIGNLADFCNECGNCDIFCPEDGGPYIVKPRFFGHREEWKATAHLDGFFLERRPERDLVLGRFDGKEYRLERASDRVTYSGEGFALSCRPDDPAGTLEGDGPDEIDLTYWHLMDYLRRALLDTSQVNYINSLWTH